MVYPADGYPITQFLINGTWTDVSSYVRQESGNDGIVITRGRLNEQGRTGPSTSDFKLNNRDGRFSNRNPTGTYYGLLPRNTQVRHIAGTADPYMRTPYDDQGATNRAETADKAVLRVVGDLEVRADIRPHTWRPGNPTAGTTGVMVIASKYALTGNQRSWAFYMTPAGQLVLVWSTDGTTGARVFASSTVNVPATSGRLSVKVTLQVNNGAAGNTVKFFTASSITGTYTQLGASVVTAGVTSIFAGTAKLCAGTGDDSIGIFTGGMGFGGRYYGLRVYNGIGGTEVARFDPTSRSVGDTSWSDGLGTPNTWTVVGSARTTTDRLRFWGELSSLPQSWDKTGTDVWMPVQAGGLIRRLTQSGSPLRSPMYRQFTQLSGKMGYWPFEDGSAATSASSALTSGLAAKTDQVTFASDSTLVGSSTALSFSSASGSIIAQPSVGTTTGTLIMMVWIKLDALPASQKTLMTLYTTGTARRIEVGCDGTNWRIEFFGSDGTSLGSTLTTMVSAGAPSLSPNGQWIGYNLLLETSGANLNYSVRWLPPNGQSFAGIGPTSIASATVGRWTSISIKGGGETAYNGASFAHLLMGNVDFNFVSSSVLNASNAYNGETAAARIARLASEEGVSVQIDGFYSQSAVMGYQTTDTFMNLIYDCADADMGILCDARDALALSYRTHQDIELRRDVTLSMTSSQLSDVPLPTEDDQSLANDVTVTQSGGASARYIKSSGALSTASPPSGVGTYDSSVTLNLYATKLLDAAGWLAHLGTWDEARYPRLAYALHRTQILSDSTLSEQVRALDVGDTVVLSGMPAWMPPDSVPLLVQGYTETLLKFRWDVAANTTPAGPYNTARYDYTDVIGTPRYDTNGSTLSAGITSSATTLALAYSTTGDNWTTTAGSYPFDIMIGGERITLTAAPGGSTSPQTFTGVTRSVNGVVKAHSAGETAKLADTRYYTR